MIALTQVAPLLRSFGGPYPLQSPLLSIVDHGDNSGATGFTPAHTYSAAGTYHWTVTLTAATGETCTSSGNITITTPSAPQKRRAVRH